MIEDPVSVRERARFVRLSPLLGQRQGPAAFAPLEIQPRGLLRAREPALGGERKVTGRPRERGQAHEVRKALLTRLRCPFALNVRRQGQGQSDRPSERRAWLKRLEMLGVDAAPVATNTMSPTPANDHGLKIMQEQEAVFREKKGTGWGKQPGRRSFQFGMFLWSAQFISFVFFTGEFDLRVSLENFRVFAATNFRSVPVSMPSGLPQMPGFRPRCEKFKIG